MPDEQFAPATAAFISEPDSVPPARGDRRGSVIACRFKLLQRLGEGGMGEVWMAEQHEPVRRQVAVKLIKPGMATDAMMRRFEAERQALALMDHPSIAKVLDGGTDEHGQPFFVMELVKGMPITKFCDQERLGFEERLKLFITVCRAVQYAHQKGIIHRDLKPSNILIALYDGEAVPKVIDFGVAKATAQRLTDKTLYTEVGQIIGTIEYMAPEQAEVNNLDIDTRADVYSLGTLLYEMLTGATPFTSAELRKVGVVAMLQKIRDVDPPKPSTRLSGHESLPSIAAARKLEPARLVKTVSGELDWIVMKSLAKERRRRYDTPNELAADLERYLHHEPVKAGPESRAYRLRKFVARNRAGVVAAGIVLAALTAGIVGTTWGLVEARRQERVAQAEASAKEAALVDATAARDAAGQRYLLAQDAFNDMVFGIQNKLEGKPGTLELRKDLLENARKGLKKLLEEAEKQGKPDSALIWSYLRLGDVELLMGNVAAAQREYQQGHAIAVKLAANAMAPAARRDLSSSYDRLGDVHLRLNQPGQALIDYGEGLAIRQRLESFQQLNANAMREVSVSYDKLGDVHLRLNQPKEAFEDFGRSLGIRQQLAADPNDLPAQRGLGVANNKFGDALLRMGSPEIALACYKDAAAVFERLAANSKDAQAQRDLSVSYDGLGNAYLRLDKPAEAISQYKKGLAITEVLAADPRDARAQRDFAVSLSQMGDVHLRLEHADEAFAFYRRSLESLEKLAADQTDTVAQRDLGAGYMRVGDAHLRLNRPAEAIALYGKSLSIREKLGADPPDSLGQRDLSVIFLKLGDGHFHAERATEALDWYEKSMAIRQRLAADVNDGVTQRDLTVNYRRLGKAHRELLHYDAAIECHRKAIALFDKWKWADASPQFDKVQIEECEAALKAQAKPEATPKP